MFLQNVTIGETELGKGTHIILATAYESKIIQYKNYH